MLCCQFLRHVLQALFFITIALKLLFLQKMQNFRALGAYIETQKNALKPEKNS